MPLGEPLVEFTWDPWTPDAVAARLAGVATPWYVVAGWAIDLHLGEVTREHEDIEIALPAAGFAEVAAALDDLVFWVVGDSERFALSDEALARHFQTWGQRADGAYVLDVFRDPGDARRWVCRRDPSISRPYADAVRATGTVPYLAPECVLLFKAKHRRDKDEADLERVAPTLDASARAWLADALARVHPGHPWLARLAGSPGGAPTSPAEPPRPGRAGRTG